MNDIFFKDRVEAGQKLAEKLVEYKSEDLVILSLPRGGVVLGKVIAKILDCPLDLVIARKIGHPLSPEYAIGAITATGEEIFNEVEVSLIDRNWLESEKKAQREDVKYPVFKQVVFVLGNC